MPEDGRELKHAILATLPGGWQPAGKRVLDFGCVQGGVLGQFAQEARVGAEVWGVDGDRAALERLGLELSPPVRLLAHDGVPPLALPSGRFDLVYSAYEFTRVGDRWAEWLLEIHRLLAPGGLLVAGLLPPRGLDALLGEEFSEAQVGHLVSSLEVGAGEYRTLGFVSSWWLRAHWGRAFEVLDRCPAPAVAGVPDPADVRPGAAIAWALRAGGLELVALRRREVRLDVDDLAAPEPGEPRELGAALHQAGIVARQLARLRRRVGVELAVLAHERDERAGEAAYLRGVAERWEEQADFLAIRLAETVAALAEGSP